MEEKLRIVAETERSDRGIAEITRQHEISRGLLWNWRSQVRRGVLFLTTAWVCRFTPSGWSRSRFIWPSSADGVVAITAAQLGYMLEGIV